MKTADPIPPPARPMPGNTAGPLAAAAFSAAVIGVMVLLRLVLVHSDVLPIGYGVPLVLFVFIGHRRFLWTTAAAFALVSFAEIFSVKHGMQSPLRSGTVLLDDVRDFALVLLDLAVIAGAVHGLIGYQQALRARQADLVGANADLAGREEEIARQNEELQSQTEELERQSEELRLANEELARRERTLENLLDLSRGLTIDLPRGETLRRICESLGMLLNGPTVASGIIERRGAELVLTCHHGFGPAGAATDRLPAERSFADLIFSHGRTGYIEDLSLRPELVIAQPASPGRRHVSVLSTPLRVGGHVIGALEVYGTEKRGWTAEQINL
ncbi:MAG TPA: GAF domain-containing protein, partial [Tepidisphaeraceae bacterium]|nr:GAF domain-containing protein [Tepidisphaeraceae bacterium]